MCLQAFCLHPRIMLKPQSEFFICETQTDTHTGLCLFPYSRVRLAHHICAVGWREVYLIFMAVRPLRAGVTTEEWSMQGLRLAKTLTLFKDIEEKMRKTQLWCFCVSNYIFGDTSLQYNSARAAAVTVSVYDRKRSELEKSLNYCFITSERHMNKSVLS